MPYYVYETLDAKKERFEFKQSIHDASYVVHPESGRPIKRVIVPGVAIRIKSLRRSTVINKLSPAATACGCASNAMLAQKIYTNSRQTPIYEVPPTKREARGMWPACSHSHHSSRHKSRK